jgi:hypothetical protein
VVRNNDYSKKNFQKDGGQGSGPNHSNSQPKTFQKAGDVNHKENYSRNNNRPPREPQQRDNNQQKDNLQRDNQKRDNGPRDNSPKDNQQRNAVQRDNAPRDNQHKDNGNQRNHYKDNSREAREPFRPHYQRPAIKPRTDETVEDIAADIVRIEKELELELKEIKSMRLGV